MISLQALSDSTRRAIVEMLARQGPTPSSAIGAQFAVTPSAVSQHLKILVAANLLTRQVAGQQRLYALNIVGLKEIEDWLARTRWFFEQHGT